MVLRDTSEDIGLLPLRPRRRQRDDLQRRAGARVRQYQPLGVQQMIGKRAAAPLSWAAILDIAEQRVAQVREMQADLVRPPGFGEGAHQRRILQPPLDDEARPHRLDSGRPLSYARQRAPDLLDRVDAEAPVGAASVASFDGERLLGRGARAYTEVFLMS